MLDRNDNHPRVKYLMKRKDQLLSSIETLKQNTAFRPEPSQVSIFFPPLGYSLDWFLSLKNKKNICIAIVNFHFSFQCCFKMSNSF